MYETTNRGQIWKNDKKGTDKHPDFTGTLDVDGQAFWVSAWKRKPDANPRAPALSFSIKPKEERQDLQRPDRTGRLSPERAKAEWEAGKELASAGDDDIGF